jgi:hypothetical protein
MHVFRLLVLTLMTSIVWWGSCTLFPAPPSAYESRNKGHSFPNPNLADLCPPQRTHLRLCYLRFTPPYNVEALSVNAKMTEICCIEPTLLRA